MERMLSRLKGEEEALLIRERAGTGARALEKATVHRAEGRLASLARLLGLEP
jgi:hypothetical protein